MIPDPASVTAFAHSALWALELALGGVGVALVALGWWYDSPMLILQGAGCLGVAMWIEKSRALEGG